MLNYFKKVFEVPRLRNRFLYTLVGIIVFRLLAQISVPGADITVLQSVFARNQALGFFSALMGGSMENFSLVLMGLSPYINASIIIQLLTVVIPSLENLTKEGGSQGRHKIQKYTRYITIPLAFLQSYGMIYLLNSLAGAGHQLVDVTNPLVILPMMITITAGTVLLMWIGEIMTEKGIGNGVSVLIFTGIVASIPSVIGQIFTLASVDSSKTVSALILIGITVLLTAFVVWFTDAERFIPLTYAKGGGGQASHLPIRVNQAGMIPIIFAVSLVTFPGLFAQLFQNASTPWVASASKFIIAQFSAGDPSWIYISIYFLLVVFFSYFYVSITFKAGELAESLQKRAAFIPGVRPGKETTEYLEKTSRVLNFYGGVFIALVAVFPYIFSFLTTETGTGSVPLLISGAGIIIIVGVVLEIGRQIKVELVTHDYNKFY